MPTVYGLVPSSAVIRGLAAVRYIGVTHKHIDDRRAEHVDGALRKRKSNKDKWICEITAHGDVVLAVPLAVCDAQYALILERQLIATLKDENNLLNVRKGGEPFVRKGARLTPEQQINHSDGQLRRFQCVLERERVSKRFAGKPKSDAQRAKIRDASLAYQAQRPRLKCPGCEMITTAGALAHHRRKSGH